MAVKLPIAEGLVMLEITILKVEAVERAIEPSTIVLLLA
jgi:hypothetical protein